MKHRVRPLLLALLLALLPLTAPVAAGEPPPLVNVCWDFGCKSSARLVLPAADWAAIRDLFQPRPPDPASERARIAEAIARFERALGPATGTDADRGGNIEGSGRPGQMDCIDESLNTAGYLGVLADRGLLAWHDLGRRHKRAPWVLDQHWTATVVDRASGTRWAVDSWFLDNGRRPYVQRLERWLAKAEPPPNPDAPG